MVIVRCHSCHDVAYRVKVNIKDAPNTVLSWFNVIYDDHRRIPHDRTGHTPGYMFTCQHCGGYAELGMENVEAESLAPNRPAAGKDWNRP